MDAHSNRFGARLLELPSVVFSKVSKKNKIDKHSNFS